MIYWQNDQDGYLVETLSTTGVVLAIAQSDETGPLQWCSRWIAEGGHADSARLEADGNNARVIQGENAGQGLFVIWAIQDGIPSNELVLMLLGEGYGSASVNPVAAPVAPIVVNPVAAPVAPITVRDTIGISPSLTSMGIQSALRFISTGLLTIYRSIKAKAALRLIARQGLATVPSIRLQLLNGKLLAMVTAHPAVVRFAWSWNNAPLAEVVGELLNPNQGMPLILNIPGFIAPNDPVTNIITVQVWQEANGKTSAHASATIKIKPTTSDFLKPPQRATAIQIRNWTINTRDLTRVEWDWGDDPPGLVEVCAYVRPQVVTNSRQIKTIHFGVIDSNRRFLLVESIGTKILKTSRNSEPVYFSVSRYLNGQSGPSLFTSPILINCGVKETPAPAPAPSTPQTVIVGSVSQNTGISSIQINEILQTALNRIKWTVARGGLVDLEQFGQFKAVWTTPTTRINPITGKVTTTPSQRRASFVFSSTFLSQP